MKKLQEEFDGKEYPDYTVEVSGIEEGDTITIKAKAKEDLGTIGTMDGTGKITWEDAFNHDARIVVSGVTVKNGEAEVARNSKIIEYETALKINFEANIIGGTIESVSPTLPYETTGKELSKDFTITGKDKNGNTITKDYTVNLKGYYNIPELRVGDYVTYNLKTPTTAELNKLNSDIATYSGATSANGLNEEKTSVGSTLLCRVLEVNSIGEPTKLISADGVNSLRLEGANGYNNAVYLINEMCETLYSGSQGTTRSLRIEDLEGKLNSDGINERDTYTNAVTYGQTKYYEIYAKYPNIALQEARMGIGTTLVNGKNQIRNGGLGLSEQDIIYTGSGDASILETYNKGITVTQTYYGNKNKAISEIYKKENNENVYYSIFHQDPIANGADSNAIEMYWLATRCTETYSVYGSFDVRLMDADHFSAGPLFYTSGHAFGGNLGVRPLVALNSGIKAEYDGKYNNTYNKWIIE